MTVDIILLLYWKTESVNALELNNNNNTRHLDAPFTEVPWRLQRKQKVQSKLQNQNTKSLKKLLECYNYLESLVTNSCGRWMNHKVGGITGRSETPSRLVIAEEFSQISRSLAVQNLKHIQENFESYPTRNWQPVESFEKWTGINSPTNSKNDAAALFWSLWSLARSLFILMVPLFWHWQKKIAR